MKKKIMPAIVVIVLILLIISGIVIVSLIQKYTPSKERADLSDYYHVTSETDVAVVLNNEITNGVATLIDGQVYLDFHFVHDVINSRFYWDENENILLYTTASDLISAEADATSYLVTKNSVDYGRVIVKATSDSAWIDLDFVNQYSDFTYSYYDTPSRVVMTNAWGEIETAVVKKNTEIREKGGIKSPILADISKSDTVTVLAQDEKWFKVATSDGVVGYIRSNALSSVATETISSEFVPETFSHIRKDFKICMAWDQLYSSSSNGDIATQISNTKGLNVVSPTWFFLKDRKGNLSSIASSDYVTYCHQHDIEVWAMVDNFDYADFNRTEDTTYILTHTSVRQNLVNQIVSMAIQYNLDGINIDFEYLDSAAVGDGYIQFIRELSLKCANNGIVLSVDVLHPASYNAVYNLSELADFADYVVMMEYDEHYSGSEEEGSVASISWVREGVSTTLKDVPSDQLILGMPLYTRVWVKTPNSDASDTEIVYNLSSSAYSSTASATLVESHNAEKVWLEDCGQFYAEYEENGSTYMIWMEDSSSTEERLRLMEEYGLAGASFWSLYWDTNAIWDTVIKYIN
ncbi:MAG: glycosyl hydrolase family 18 protein [Agathobacter sp.]